MPTLRDIAYNLTYANTDFVQPMAAMGAARMQTEAQRLENVRRQREAQRDEYERKTLSDIARNTPALQDGTPDYISMQNMAYQADPILGEKFAAALGEVYKNESALLRGRQDRYAQDREEQAAKEAMRLSREGDVADTLSQIDISNANKEQPAGEITALPDDQYQGVPDYRAMAAQPMPDRIRRTMMPYADTEIGKTLLSDAQKIDANDRLSRPNERQKWAVQIARGAEIDAMPEGPEKDAAIDRWTRDFAASTWASQQERAINAATQKAAATTGASTRARLGVEEEKGGGVNPVVYDRETKLRDEFTGLAEVKTLKTMYPQYIKTKSAYDAYKAGKASKYELDQQLGFFAAKALDAGSVVMPAEFERFAKGNGWKGSVKAYFNQIASGGLRLTDDNRKALYNIVGRAMSAARKAAKEQGDIYEELATSSKVNPKNVTVGISKMLMDGNKKQPAKASSDFDSLWKQGGGK